jgi:uncharacterized protein YheU (UPF0270 family)
MNNQYATFIEGTPDGDVQKELAVAIKNQRTWISKGPIVETFINDMQKAITFTIIDTNKPGFLHADSDSYYLTLRTKKGTFTKQIFAKTPLIISYQELENETMIIPKLYLNDTTIENLVAISPTIILP